MLFVYALSFSEIVFSRFPPIFPLLYSLAGPNDVFISGDSGAGYLNPSVVCSFVVVTVVDAVVAGGGKGGGGGGGGGVAVSAAVGVTASCAAHHYLAMGMETEGGCAYDAAVDRMPRVVLAAVSLVCCKWSGQRGWGRRNGRVVSVACSGCLSVDVRRT